jgi:hypothetical protein
MAVMLSAMGCGMLGDKENVDRAEVVWKSGNAAKAIDQTKMLLNMAPRNFHAKRLLKKIKAQLIVDMEESMASKNYKDVIKNADIILGKLDKENGQAKQLRIEAEKYLNVEKAKESLAADNPVAALRFVKAALKIDPELQEAKELQGKANGLVEGKIAGLLDMAQGLIDQKQFEKLRDLSQDILTIAPQNREVADLLREANAQILARDKQKNLTLAQKFLDDGVFDSARSRAEEVLKVDPGNKEARYMLESAKAELTKPTLYLTGFMKIKGMVIAHIEIERPEGVERIKVVEGDVFDGFKVSAVDIDLKAVVVTFVRTKRQQTLTLRTE